MAERVVHFSDLTDQMITDPAQAVQIDVLQHPDLPEGEPRRLEATEEEVRQVGELSVSKAVIIEVTMPGEDQEPQRYVLTAANFGKLAVGRSMSDVLTQAKPIVPEKPSRSREPGRDYETLEFAGFPHRGTTSDEEARLVRENLDQVNANLAAAGKRLIDPQHPDHAKRYGFDGSRDAGQPPLEGGESS